MQLEKFKMHNLMLEAEAEAEAEAEIVLRQACQTRHRRTEERFGLLYMYHERGAELRTLKREKAQILASARDQCVRPIA